MAYNQQQGGYGQYNPYGQGGNPYGQQQQSNQYEQPYGHTGNYSERPDLEHHASSRYDEESAQGGSYEMSNMNNSDPNRILNEVRLIDGQIDTIEENLQRLRGLHKQYLASPDAKPGSPLATAVDTSSQDIINTYRGLTNRVRRIFSDPEAGKPRNQAQVNKVNRRLKAAINQAQQVDREYRDECKAKIVREYRIVRPDASDAEVQEVIDNGSNQQIFSNALISADRRGDARKVEQSVKSRHQALQQIEKDMMELAQLFNDLEAMVVQQEPATKQIEDKGEQATGHVVQANTELDGAVKKARSARKKKWYCLGIAILIIIIIVVVVVVVVEVTKKS